MSWLLCEVINPRAFGWSLQMVVSAGAVAPPLLLGVLVIVLASLSPAPTEKLVETG